jgi:hypothetical protein
MAHRKLTRRTSKIRPVPINLMVVPPALISQRPFIKAHGDHLAQTLDLNMLGFPIINHREGKHWLCDGQHRIYALKANGFGMDNLDCEVYEDLTDEEMAQLFLGRDSRRAIAPFVKFHIACTAGYERENAIRRVVEANGMKISRNKTEGAISAVSALIKVYENAATHDVAVGFVVRVARQSFNGDPLGLDAAVLEALGQFANRYNGKAVEKNLTEKLSTATHGIRGIVRRAEAMREKTGKPRVACLSAIFVEVYNRGVFGKARLESWWKDREQGTGT